MELGIFLLADCCLNLVEGLFDKGSILDIEDSIGIALDFRVMGHHDAGGGGVLTISVWPYSVDVE